MTVAPQSNDYGISLRLGEIVRIIAMGLAIVWVQIFVVETTTLAFGLRSIEIAVPTANIVDLPTALVATLTVRHAAIAPWLGFTIGLVVDSYQPSLFGLHAGLFCLAAVAGPPILGHLPGVRALAAGTATLGAAVLLFRAALYAFTGNVPPSLLGAGLSLAISTATVAIFAFPMAGFLDRRSRRARYLNRSSVSTASSPLQRASQSRTKLFRR